MGGGAILEPDRGTRARYPRGTLRPFAGSILVTLRRASQSSQQDMAARLAERVDAMQGEREAAQRATGTALILVKHRVVEDAFREA
jgi:hypothetical protein